MQNSVVLPYGLIMLYNIRDRSPYHRIKAPVNCNWGSVYSISPYGGGNAQLNDWVLYNGDNAKCVLAFSNTKSFPIIEQTIILATEIPTP